MRYIWTETARRAVKEIVEAFNEPDDSTSPKIRTILLTGFSGLGKTSLLEALVKNDTAFGCSVLAEPPMLKDKDEDGEIPTRTICDVNLEDAQKIEAFVRKEPNIRVKKVILKGWTASEIRELLPAIVSVELTPLKPEEFIEVCLGSTFLMSIFENSRMDYAQAVRVAARYLHSQLVHIIKDTRGLGNHSADDIRGLIAPYLQMPISDTIITQLIREVSGGYMSRLFIYDDIPWVLEALQKSPAQPGPYLVAPESVRVLDAMVQVSDPFAPQWYDALVTDVPAELLQEFVELFREDAPRCGKGTGNGRIGAFGSMHRKVGLVVRDGKKESYRYETETSCCDCDKKEKALRKSAQMLGLPVGSGTIYVHQHDHPGGSGACNIPSFVWAFESWAQQRRLPYIVDNVSLDRRYCYRPAEKKLEFLKLEFKKLLR